MRKPLRTILIVVLAIVLVWGIVSSLTSSLKRRAIQKELDQCVISYLDKTYDGNFKVKKSSYQHYEEGFTGGLYMYDFLIEDENGEQYKAEYNRYMPLDESTVEDITFYKIPESKMENIPAGT